MQTEEQGLETRNIRSGEGTLDGDGEKNFAEEAERFVFKGTDDPTYREFQTNLDANQIKKAVVDKNFYEVTFRNEGGLVTPLLIEFTYADGSTERQKIPAEIWRYNEKEVKKVFVKEKEVVDITLDPDLKTADVNISNNYFPRREGTSRFDRFKDKN